MKKFDEIPPQQVRPAEAVEDVTIQTLSGYHFLLVEDDAINSEILRELLQMRGATYTSKKMDRRLWRNSSTPLPDHDAIFMDIQMPVMNGL